MKLVHDILLVLPGSPPRSPLEPFIRPTRAVRPASIPFALIQWGNPTDGYGYEIICPFCAETIGECETNGTFHDLCIHGGGFMALHREKCTRFGESYEVEVTKRPLGTSRRPKVV